MKMKTLYELVSAAFSRTEPRGYADQLKQLRREWQPEGWEERLVQIMAEASCRMRGCDYLETEVLMGNLQAPSVPLGDLECQRILEQLSSYRRKLATDLAHSVAVLKRQVIKRKQAEALAASKFAEMKPCTSVIQ